MPKSRVFLAELFALAAIVACGARGPKYSGAGTPSAQVPVPVYQPAPEYQPPPDYQRLFDSVGDKCYPGDQFPTNLAGPAPLPAFGPSFSATHTAALISPVRLGILSFQAGRVSALFQANSQVSQAPKARAVSSVENLSLLSDIEFAKFKNNELFVVGQPAKPGQAFRPEDWYAAFRGIAGTEAPGVTIDPGPNSQVMQVRYFGGVQQTAMGNTLFEADRTLKLLSTGFDNSTCALWPERPQNIPTELDLITAEIGDGSSPMQGEGWHRFWFEPSETPIEVEGSTIRIPKDRLVVKDESIPPGLPGRRSAREFASAITTNFLGMSERIQAFSDLQRDAALVVLAKWMRDKEIPADADWIGGGNASETATPTTTPSITVLRAKVTDRFYLRYGIHGGVDFQKDNLYGNASSQSHALSETVDRTERKNQSSWDFTYENHPYRAVRLMIPNPVRIEPRWVVWQRVVTSEFAQPGVFRINVPPANFVVRNSTRGPLKLRLSGPLNRSEEVQSVDQPVALRIVPGYYQLSVTAQCGMKDDAVTVSEGESYELRYECVPVSGVGQILTGGAPLATSGGGSFEVVNNTGGSLSVVVAGQLYTVTPGQFTIRLPAGNFKAYVSATCGVSTESLNVTQGSEYRGTYSCQTIFR